MTKQEQRLLDAAREILYDFDRYGEVLQHSNAGEYDTESAIGQLQTVVNTYDN